jgi:2'-5' RNA ligase
MAHYLIEIRFQGKAKAEIKQLIYHLDSKFDLHFFSNKRAIPHVTLAGPLLTRSEKRLIIDFITTCSATPFCSFKINGYGFFDKTRVVYIHIDPSEKLKTFRRNLAQKIGPYSTLQQWDKEQDFSFHATLAMKLSPQKFGRVKNYVASLAPSKYKYFLFRATLIKNQEILCEYDFLQRRVLNRSEALDKRQGTIDRELFNQFFEGNYNPDFKMGENIRIPENIVSDSMWEELILYIKKFFRLR